MSAKLVVGQALPAVQAAQAAVDPKVVVVPAAHFVKDFWSALQLYPGIH
jgi:hypothetical protein